MRILYTFVSYQNRPPSSREVSAKLTEGVSLSPLPKSSGKRVFFVGTTNISAWVLFCGGGYSILFYYEYSSDEAILRRDSHGRRDPGKDQLYLGGHQGRYRRGQERRPRADAFPARTERLPAHRPREGAVRRFPDGGAFRRRVQSALSRLSRAPRKWKKSTPRAPR